MPLLLLLCGSAALAAKASCHGESLHRQQLRYRPPQSVSGLGEVQHQLALLELESHLWPVRRSPTDSQR